ncbi:MAG: divalent metal cation transporter, partial [Lactiplantibacillus plantarum]
MEKKTKKRSPFNVAMGAAFMMAMAAVGPGFLTQTATFTSKMGADFGFAILICILVDIVVQLNIWRIIIVSGRHAQ